MKDPIAIVGCGAVLPGALSPDELWHAVLEGRDLLKPVPDGAWPVPPELVERPKLRAKAAGPHVPFRGGFVQGFDAVFDAKAYDLPTEEVLALDRSSQWLLHAARQAVGELAQPEVAGERAAIVVGNLSYPTRNMTELAYAAAIGSALPGSRPVPQRQWLDRFVSGRPAHVLAQGLGVTGPAFCLDAACASSLYAVKHACDYLRDGIADVVVTGGVNGCDNIFLHRGFAEIGALSPTARSRPFSKHADGLLPAEGAAALVLKRLEDAVRAGDHIHAVIRGVGLSNDGRCKGLLLPDSGGQVRAIEAAYRGTGLCPSDLSLMECHATGTPGGDGTEIESLIQVMGDIRDLPVGSLKSNIGHLVTVAGTAAIIKVIGAMKHGLRPATLHAEDWISEFENSPLRPLLQKENWPDDVPRRAGINNFGFGGSNAHLVLEEFVPARRLHSVPVTSDVFSKQHAGEEQRNLDDDIVVCGIGVIHGNERGFGAFARKVAGPNPSEGDERTESVVLPLLKLGFPPNDLKQSLSQQTLALEAGLQAVTDIDLPASERCGVLIGMGADFDAVRPGLAWRMEQALRDQQAGEGGAPSFDADIGGLTGPAYVMGAMPNLPANRINIQLDMRGLGFTVSSEELSGLTALDIGIRALRQGELDFVLAGAVDLSTEVLHRKACKMLPEIGERTHADGAIVFALKRRADAEHSGDPIISVLDVGAMERLPRPGEAVSEASALGQAHAASALFELAAGLATRLHGGHLLPKGREVSDDRPAEIGARSFTGWTQSASLRPLDRQPASLHDGEVPYLAFAAAETSEQLAVMLRSGRSSSKGHLRIAVTAGTAGQLAGRIDRSIQQLEAGGVPEGPGIEFGSTEFDGDVAFVFPGLASAYPGVLGQSLKSFPEVRDRLDRVHGPEAFNRIGRLKSAWKDRDITVSEIATVGAGASIFNVTLLRSVLGVQADACLGVSMGELSMMFSHGLWEAPITFMEGLERSGFYRNIAEDSPLLPDYFGLEPEECGGWRSFEIVGPVEELRDLIDRTEHVWLLIINSPNRCLIGGENGACSALVARLPRRFQAMPRPKSIAFHAPFAERFSDDLRTHLASQETRTSNGIRYYLNAVNDSIDPTTAKTTELWVRQGVQTVDFPSTVLKAWDDGVRAFIDVGPRSTLASSIHCTLGHRPHISVGLDLVRRDDLSQLADACAKLFAYGVTVSIQGLARRLDRMRRAEAPDSGRTISFPAHLPEIVVRLNAAGVGGAERSIDPQPEEFQRPHVMPRPPCLPRSAPVTPSAGYSHWPQACSERRVMTDPCLTSRREDPEDSSLLLVAQGRATAFSTSGSATAMPLPPDTSSAVESVTRRPVRSATPPSGRAKPKPVVVGRSSVPEPLERLRPSGPTLDRAALELASRDKISKVFGEMFVSQDGYLRQCRMPAPPLLLADRVTGLEGEPGSMGKGICWTETDVRPDSWYLHDGLMPTGILIEAGQADLLLISWLGADFLNQGERVYRLLGCEITFHEGDLPRIGDTIGYQIHVDAHANVGDTRLFFFRYDACIGDRLISSVRHGQAGFFTDAELANSDGVLWSPDEDAPKSDARMDPAPATSLKRSFSAAELKAFAEGDAFACFGAGFEFAAAHQRTPKIPAGRMQLIDRVPLFDPAGGPWGRGYLMAECDVPMDSWFYDGHFHNDPCMPGTLMAEAAVQALELYVAALGFTIERDGWRFQPATGEAFKFECRGQVVPDKLHHITYEIFIEEVIDGVQPKVYAALLARSDGFKVFLCRRFGVTLVRDWPLSSRSTSIDALPERRIVSPSGDVPGDHASLMASAWGRPSAAFGAMYRELDVEGCPPRLPGPPYKFISRILSVDCPPGRPTIGGKLTSEYDVPADAWYFRDGGTGTMPFSVLSEVALQPCGWFASYMGYALGKRVKVRNLNGKNCKTHREIWPDSGTVTVEVSFIKAAQVGPMTLVFYEVTCRLGDDAIISLETDFGFFPPEALAQQRGLATTDAMRAVLKGPQQVVSREESKAVLAGKQQPLLPSGLLGLVDEVTGFWPDGGEAGLGRAMGRQRVEPSAWYFKAHFFTDPVQAGSLGLEALFTLLKAVVKMKNLHQGFKFPRFESPALGEALVWAYRGQVVPANKEVLTEIEIVEVINESESVLIRAKGSLWVDGLRIYEVSNYCLRIRELEKQSTPAVDAGPGVVRIDPDAQPWLKDHKPSYVIPAYPLLGVAGLLLESAGADAAAAPVRRIDMLEVRGWLLLDAGPLDLLFRRVPMSDGSERVTFHRVRGGVPEKRPAGVAISSREPGGSAPDVWQRLEHEWVESDPYGAGGLFHDGAFQVVDSIKWGDNCSSFDFDAAGARASADDNPTILLDTLFHGFPHHAPERWYGAVAAGQVAFPYRLDHFTLYGALPRSGRVTVVTRRRDMPTLRTLRFDVQVQLEGRVIIDATMTEALIPTGVPQCMTSTDVRRYCQDRVAMPAFSVSSLLPDCTRLTTGDLQRASWLPGTYQVIYDVSPEARDDPRASVEQIAIKDHIAKKYAIHPADVRIESDSVRPGANPSLALSSLLREWVDDCSFEVRDV
ncbi:type I polyketide synthase [Denitrobaculum tricleocarpae]|uniref:Acyltransferase domain-containing protein n=1 Tax=Denitrobaculum tricleocarpae TaxID=2591009 RepID=A0A545TN19_9PROT|nr:type I polyketide synthase [Denitrobaculum tricleocarpae]TQV78629.1 acyltransferase domain-containing protein [Denitrobaculum tricleocarpae]